MNKEKKIVTTCCSGPKPNLWDRPVTSNNLLILRFNMSNLTIKEVSTRLGRFCIIKINKMLIVTPCDTRVKILQALSEAEMTAEEISGKVGSAYSTVMDHMDVLEKLEIVSSQLRRTEGKRRIAFSLREDLGESIS
ncbi:MAG: winged helix-turn-helix domain-containing protein, partial [Nitrososphaerales archaeon]